MKINTKINPLKVLVKYVQGRHIDNFFKKNNLFNKKIYSIWYVKQKLM